MASIVTRGPNQYQVLIPNQYQVLIRRKGHPSQTKTFETKREAKAWANVIESEMVRAVFTDRTEAEQTILGEALERYKREITVKKRPGHLSEFSPAVAEPLTRRQQARIKKQSKQRVVACLLQGLLAMLCIPGMNANNVPSWWKFSPATGGAILVRIVPLCSGRRRFLAHS